MKERPILFSTEMVKAILDGRKTMTRRVVKPQPELLSAGYEWHVYDDELCARKFHPEDIENNAEWEIEPYIKCPYGQIGDVLWVRESWQLGGWINSGIASYEAESTRHRMKYVIEYKDEKRRYIYPDDVNYESAANLYTYPGESRWHPSIHMPRWASRITLELINIRVERLQEINNHDAGKEGISLWPVECGASDQRWRFSELWDSLNAKRGYSWESNPWVWILEFKKL